MKNFRVAIVEDEKEYSNILKKHLTKYSGLNDIKFIIDEYVDGYNLLDEYKYQYDILFLDIELKQLNGMKTAEKIREFDKKVIIVFVTNLINFAVKGYEVDAQSFLIKPVSYFKFSREIQKIMNKINNKITQFIVVNTDSGMKKLEASEINYIESMKHELIIDTDDKKYRIWGTLKELERKLETYYFFRCNNSYIVNLAKVKGIEGDFVNIGKDKLKISRSRKKEFMNVLTDYFKGGI